ncbi:MAG: TetR/AcrR family transcriptional regulator [Candidatus Kapabacteria bacterium]|nr:TetR/AcrR family transcriptional regulator [Candidatus Kapabacteria bacterium]
MLTDFQLKIIKHSAELFSKQGFTAVKTDEIAQKLAISKKTLYENFESKEEILRTAVDYFLKNIDVELQAINQRLENSSGEDLIEILIDLWDIEIQSLKIFTNELIKDIIRLFPDLWDLIMNFRDERFKLYFNKIYSMGIDQGIIRKDISEDILYLIFNYSTKHIMIPDIIKDLPLSTKNVMEQIFQIILSGALTPEYQNKYYQKLGTNNQVKQ